MTGSVLARLYDDLAVSRETQDRLAAYLALLRKWQPKINLVSPSSLDHAEDRHFADSLQLLPLLRPSDKTLVDFGSGAGFPGLVLAIAHPETKVHLVESDARKGEFMKSVSRETSIPISIHTSRIEALAPFPVDVISARALAGLTALLGYALPFTALNPACRLILMKGENWQSEVDEAKSIYQFDLTDHASITDAKARILVIENLSCR